MMGEDSPLAKPHGIRVRSKERHAAGASGISLRLSALVSHRGDVLSLMSESQMKRVNECRFLS